MTSTAEIDHRKAGDDVLVAIVFAAVAIGLLVFLLAFSLSDSRD